MHGVTERKVVSIPSPLCAIFFSTCEPSGLIKNLVVSAETNKFTPPLILLIRVNLLQSWRKLKAVRAQSRLLSSLISFFILGYLALAFWIFRLGLKFLGAFPGLGQMLTE